MIFKRRVREVLAATPLVDGLFRRFVWSRIHFPENEMRFLHSLPKNAIDVAIDVGAATGSYAWILNRISREIYAFEPGLEHNLHLNRINFKSRVKVINAAVGNFTGVVDLYTPGEDESALHSATVSACNPITNGAETKVRKVEQIDLNGFFKRNLRPGQSIDLIKVDVEGYENAVFEGAQEILEAHHPMIICEIEARHNHRCSEVFEFFHDMEYVCYCFRDGRFERFVGTDPSEFQLEGDLETRLGPDYDPLQNRYINNFVFQHALSRIKVVR